jgi:hypothetical protein
MTNDTPVAPGDEQQTTKGAEEPTQTQPASEEDLYLHVMGRAAIKFENNRFVLQGMTDKGEPIPGAVLTFAEGNDFLKVAYLHLALEAPRERVIQIRKDLMGADPNLKTIIELDKPHMFEQEMTSTNPPDSFNTNRV